jgi:hypothetical protein
LTVASSLFTDNRALTDAGGAHGGLFRRRWQRTVLS